MRRLLALAAGLFLLVGLVPAVHAGTIAPDCAYGEVKMYRYTGQNTLMGSDCTDSADRSYDVNFGDSLDAFRGNDNNDADSWQAWVSRSTYQHCLYFFDSTAGGAPWYAVTLYAGGTHYWGDLPSSWYNRTSRYTLAIVNPGTAC